MLYVIIPKSRKSSFLLLLNTPSSFPQWLTWLYLAPEIWRDSRCFPPAHLFAELRIHIPNGHLHLEDFSKSACLRWTQPTPALTSPVSMNRITNLTVAQAWFLNHIFDSWFFLLLVISKNFWSSFQTHLSFVYLSNPSCRYLSSKQQHLSPGVLWSSTCNSVLHIRKHKRKDWRLYARLGMPTSSFVEEQTWGLWEHNPSHRRDKTTTYITGNSELLVAPAFFSILSLSGHSKTCEERCKQMMQWERAQWETSLWGSERNRDGG